MGLDREAFEVYEDKIQQKIVSFGCDDAPLSMGIVFDASGSMGPKLERSRAAVAEFLKTANARTKLFWWNSATALLAGLALAHSHLSEIQEPACPFGRRAEQRSSTVFIWR